MENYFGAAELLWPARLRQARSVWFIQILWFVWFIRFVWFN